MDFTKYPYFEFRGQRSNEHNMRLLNQLEFVIPEASLDFQEVDGKQSDIIYNRNKYKDIEKRFPARLFKQPDQSINQQLRSIAAWLYTEKNYSPLIFSDHPDYYYQALCYASIQSQDEQREWLDVDIRFKCQPFMFRLNGEEEREINSSGGFLVNPEAFSSQPIITFNKTTSTADSHIYVNSKPFRIAKEAGAGLITIDSETGLAYKQGGVNVSKHCLLNPEGYAPITLEPGRNEFRFNNINLVKIRPRWRTLAV